MKELEASISAKETDELILIANGSTTEWQKTAINLAKNELKKRGVAKEYEKKVVDHWKAEEHSQVIAYQERLQRNEMEGYSTGMMLYVFVVAPLILAGKWSVGLSLIGLRRENYQKKFIQRMVLLFSGTTCWLLFLIYSANSFHTEQDKIRRAEINKVDISEWEKSYYGSDSSLTNLHKDSLKKQ